MALASRAEELRDLLLAAKWAATGGYDVWAKHDGRHLPLRDKMHERDSRVEAYAKL